VYLLSIGAVEAEHELTQQEYALKELDYSKMTEKDRKQILAEV
jgi:hypothetical protein